MVTYNSLTLFYLYAAMLYPVGIFVLNEIKMKKDEKLFSKKNAAQA